MNKERTYYVLQPVNDSESLIYVPIDNDMLVRQMKKTFTRQEVDAMILQLKDQPDIWVEDRNQRKELFTTILHSGDCLKITNMLKSIYHQKTKLSKKKKKLSASDEGIYREAEKTLTQSFSLILNIPANQVIGYIISQVEDTNNDFNA